MNEYRIQTKTDIDMAFEHITNPSLGEKFVFQADTVEQFLLQKYGLGYINNEKQCRKISHCQAYFRSIQVGQTVDGLNKKGRKGVKSISPPKE